MQANIRAHWKGSLKTGKGHFTSKNPLLHETGYHFSEQHPNKRTSVPEEFLAAAHTACFNMTFAMILSQNGLEANFITTECTITYSGDKVSHATLHVNASISDISQDEFTRLIKEAKELCPIGRAFNYPVSITSELFSHSQNE